MNGTPKLIQFTPSRDFVVIRPAKPRQREGRVELPQQSAAKPWHGEMVVDTTGLPPSKQHTIVWYSRSFPMEPIRMAREDGTWEESGLVTLHVQAIRGYWTCTPEQAEALMNPDAEPVDPVLEREMKKAREAKV